MPSSRALQSTAAIRLRGVRKSFGREQVLSDVNLEVRSSTIFLLGGSNGAGKSTLMRIITGLLRPDAGSVEIFGVAMPKGWRSVAGRLGVVPERLAVFERLTVHENVTLAGACHGLDSEAVEARARELLEFFGLWEDRNILCAHASQGMGKKTALAAAVINAPEALLLDEPFSGLDALAVVSLSRILAALRSCGAAILVASHILPAVAGTWDRAAALSQGVLRELPNATDPAAFLSAQGREPPRVPPWLGG